MTRRTLLSVCFLCACGLALGGCSSLGTSPRSVAPATTNAAPPAPDPAATSDSGTPIPDVDNTAPVIQWQDLTITTVPKHYDNLWNYLGKHFTLSAADGDGRVQRELDWFSSHGEYLQRVATRARPYLYYIVQEIDARKMPLDIALLPVVESAFDPFAYSNARAAGLWQFIPGTGRHFSLKQDWWYDGRRDVAESTRAALDYLQYLHDQFNGDWLLALAAYNSGGGTVSRAIAYNQRRGLPTDFWHLNLPAQTRAYVPRLLAICKLVATQGHFGVDLPPIPNSAYLAQVDVGGQIDLATAAKLAGITTEQMYLLNPGFNRWATDPDGPYTLLVPLDKQAAFQQGLAAMPPHDRVQWATHRVRNGDTLGGIAHRYHTTLAVLRELNGIHGNMIYLHQTLLVPVARATLADAALDAEARVARLQNHDSAHVHHVRSGESLWTIARHYGVDVKQLAAWNRISVHSLLHVGQRLVIRSGSAHFSMVSFEQGPDNTHRTIYYTVRQGDSLSSISSRFRVSVGEIAGWNNLDTGDYLQPGQRLTLHVDVTDQSTSS
ncbi:MAG TPA: LysM peptidoglycan-binding domain-containing protein [Gammaproteobacteria bacterium]|nr:LysM peptidoglycan-binding domain-containing protein [Gammaproteobacteria bacterium]